MKCRETGPISAREHRLLGSMLLVKQSMTDHNSKLKGTLNTPRPTVDSLK